jgi:probable HAF family extracellular repeat protein
VAGNSQVASGYSHAFVAQAGSLVDLGTLGGNSSFAYGINSAGDTTGFSWDAAGNMHAFLYKDGVMVDLNSLIAANSGWVLSQAFAINDSGQIAGSGLLDGVEYAFRLDYVPEYSDPNIPSSTVPEPPTWTFAITGLLLVALSKSRHYSGSLVQRPAPCESTSVEK